MFLSLWNKTKKMDIKDIQIGKEEITIVFIHRQHKTKYRKSYRINKILLGLMNKFSKFADTRSM